MQLEYSLGVDVDVAALERSRIEDLGPSDDFTRCSVCICNAIKIVVLIEQPVWFVVDGDEAMLVALSQAVQVRLPRGLLSHSLRSY